MLLDSAHVLSLCECKSSSKKVPFENDQNSIVSICISRNLVRRVACVHRRYAVRIVKYQKFLCLASLPYFLCISLRLKKEVMEAMIVTF